jgi:hypothetical protein
MLDFRLSGNGGWHARYGCVLIKGTIATSEKDQLGDLLN